MASTIEDELGELCRACGMCCDGSLFGRVGLQPGEVAIARRHRLRVLERGGAFEQPCPAFEPTGAGCTIYAERPQACRVFRCKLFERHRTEGGELADRLAAVARVRELVAMLEASELTPEELEGDLREAYDEVAERLERDFARA